MRRILYDKLPGPLISFPRWTMDAALTISFNYTGLTAWRSALHQFLRLLSGLCLSCYHGHITFSLPMTLEGGWLDASTRVLSFSTAHFLFYETILCHAWLFSNTFFSRNMLDPSTHDCVGMHNECVFILQEWHWYCTFYLATLQAIKEGLKSIL